MIYYRGRWLIEPEIKALLTKLEDLNKELRSEADRVLRENAELRAKVESAERQKAEYDNELRKAKKLLKSAAGIIKDVDCNEDYLCDECEYRAKCDGGFSFYWRYAAEALALIGEEGENDA